MTNKKLSKELSCSFAKNGSPDCSAGSPPPCASYALCSLALCEICGIEGKWIKYQTETTDACINFGSKKVYPDFEQPTNFVKLLNVLHANGFHFRTYGFYKKQPITSYVLEHFVDKFRNRNDEEAEDFKQVIREQEWSYE